MPSAPRITLATVALAMTVATIACEPVESPPASNRAATVPAPPAMDSMPADPVTGWRDENGPLLAIADDSLSGAMIIPGRDDSSSAFQFRVGDTLPIDIFSPAGKMGTAILQRVSPGRDQCLDWPTARVRRGTRSRPERWSVGFASGHVLPLSLDSVAGLPRADSTRLVTEIARLASLAPDDTALLFRGLPFRVQAAYLLRPVSGAAVVIATVIRTVNQEANARAEHLFLITDRENGRSGSPHVLRYGERSSGPEEASETAEILGAVLIGADQTPTIVIGRSDDSGMAFSLIERDDRGGWHLRWSSPFSDC